ncbi:MAG: hypothetical protein FWC64_04130 [Treponema sp.]|nr:hypothetical protein [Treponema sp.]
MKKPLTRGRALGILLFTALCVIMGVKFFSVFAVGSPDAGLDGVTAVSAVPAALPPAGGVPGQALIHEAVQELPPAPAPALPVPLFPLEYALAPIPLDPWDMLTFPVQNWRDSRFELFSWDRYPEILILDISTKEMQDRLLKRLAFFAEKAGFRGRLAYDHEIAHLHGWNAHNYRAEDLAVFFETARRTGFPLLDEEWELEAMLLRAGVLRVDSASRIVPGRGAVLSLTRESVPALRTRFMAHEVFHGLYFIYEDFREFSRQRWEAFPEFGRRFLLTFFEIQAYCTEYDFLVINEFMGHLLQLPLSQAPWYFGQHVPNRLFREGFSHALPGRYEVRDGGVRFWPDLADAFTAEAEVFSRYVDERWGLVAGRVWRHR